MKLIFSENAWDDYLYWQRTDRKLLNRINTLIKDIQRQLTLCLSLNFDITTIAVAIMVRTGFSGEDAGCAPLPFAN